MPRKAPVPVEDRRTGSPAEQMRRDLARFREVGRDFDTAWRVAIGRVRWPHDTQQRHEWKAILLAGRHHWRAAYERDLPTQREVATGQLAYA